MDIYTFFFHVFYNNPIVSQANMCLYLKGRVSQPRTYEQKMYTFQDISSVLPILSDKKNSLIWKILQIKGSDIQAYK